MRRSPIRRRRRILHRRAVQFHNSRTARSSFRPLPPAPGRVVAAPIDRRPVRHRPRPRTLPPPGGRRRPSTWPRRPSISVARGSAWWRTTAYRCTTLPRAGATSNWSRPKGTTHTGTPRARAFWVAPIPPWVTEQTARSSNSPCGTKRRTVALSGIEMRAGIPHGNVATTCTGSSLSAVIAASGNASSPCRSDDVVTSTIGRSTSSIQSLLSAKGRSNSQGPIICTASPQSGWGYSNGSALATSMSRARLTKSSLDAIGLAPGVA
ncbi:hypothetical protein ACVWWN_006137 [Mycobacterium sp. URHB0021]